MDIDTALDTVGGYRRYHLSMFFLLGFSLCMPLAWQSMSIVFTGWEPPHHCKIPLDAKHFNETIPVVPGPEGKETLSKCQMYSNSTSGLQENETIGCQNGWTYDSGGYYTIVQQWDLVCEHNYLAEVSQVSFQIGCLISTLGFSFLTDKFGRKYVHILTHMLIGGIGVVVALSNSYIMFLIARGIIGMLLMANSNAALTYLMELFDSRRRAFVSIGIEFQWISCYLSLPLLAYLMSDWRVLYTVISCSSFLWIIYFWIMPESPQWLAAVGRFKEAEEILEKFARWNGVNLATEVTLLRDTPPSINLAGGITLVREDQISGGESVLASKSPADEELVKRGDLKERSKLRDSKNAAEPVRQDSDTDIHRLEYSGIRLDDSGIEVKEPEIPSNTSTSSSADLHVPISALVRDPYLRRVLIISNLLWFANCLVYNGLILSSPALAGSRFLNFFFMGLVEIPGSVLVISTIDRVGRRLSTSLYHIIAGVPLAILVFIPAETSSGVSLSPLIVTLTILSKFGISASFAVIILYTRELLPTSVRGTGAGAGQILGNCGDIIAPMSMYVVKTRFYWLPNVLFGTVSIAVGLIVLLLPETARRPLPQTLDDLHDMFRSKSPRRSAKVVRSTLL